MHAPTVFIEKDFRYSTYLKFEDFQALAAEMPKLSILRIEMERVHPGMTDFILRVSTPKYSGPEVSGTLLSIRGDRRFTKYDTLTTLATTICAEMAKRKDETHTWDAADIDHLAEMMFGPIKYFSTNTRIARLQFSTEALS